MFVDDAQDPRRMDPFAKNFLRSEAQHLLKDSEHGSFLKDLCENVYASKINLHMCVNSEIIITFWKVGLMLSDKSLEDDLSEQEFENLSIQLEELIGWDMGFKKRNIWRMREFAKTYSEEIVAKYAINMPWMMHLTIIDWKENHLERIWYVIEAVENQWGQADLVNALQNDLYSKAAMES